MAEPGETPSSCRAPCPVLVGITQICFWHRGNSDDNCNNHMAKIQMNKIYIQYFSFNLMTLQNETRNISLMLSLKMKACKLSGKLPFGLNPFRPIPIWSKPNCPRVNESQFQVSCHIIFHDKM